MHFVSLLSAAIAAAALGVPPHPVTLQPDPDFAYIRQAYAYEADAASNLDADKQFAYVTNDYTLVTAKGTLSKPEAIGQDDAVYEELGRNGETLSESVTVLAMKHQGDNVLAVVRIGVRVSAAPNGTASTDAIDVVQRDVWIPTKDGWACQVSVQQKPSVKGSAAGASSMRPAESSVTDRDFAFVRRAYAYEADGASRMDVNKELKYTTDDYFLQHGAKAYTKAELIQDSYNAYRNLTLNNVHFHETVEIVSLKRDGNNILATVRLHATGSQSVDDFVNGTGIRTARIRGVQSDTWVRTPSGWACRQTIITDVAGSMQTPNN